MFENWNSILNPFATGAILWISISRFGFYIDDKIDESLRSQMHELFNRVDRYRWPDSFVSLFDRLFSSARSGRPRFSRSVLASCSVLAIITVSWLILKPSSGPDSAIEEIIQDPWYFTMIVIPYVVLINVVGDYFSLWETRFIIGKMAKRRDGSYRILLLLFDLLASALIFFLGLVFGSVVFCVNWVLAGGSLSFFSENSWLESVLSLIEEIVYDLLLLEKGIVLSAPNAIADFFGIFFYTTFLTSVWIWIYLIGLVLLPMLKGLWKIFQPTKYPVGAAMCVGGALFSFVLVASHFVPI